MNIRKAFDDSYNHEFFLVGSQFLGTARPDSDWDYVVTAKAGVIAFLRKLGFESVKDDVDVNRVYGNNKRYVKAIMQARCPEDGVLVQVAVVADARMKVRIMQVLKKNATLRALDLSLHGSPERNRLWDAMYALVGWNGEDDDGDYGQKPKKKKSAVPFLVDDDPGF